MEGQTALRLQDLLKIALGAPEMTNVSIAVLHSLIDILLKKLNCQDEKVSLSAYECESLNKILETAKTSPLSFNDENVDMIDDKLNRLEKLEKNINSLDCKLNHHLQEIQSFTKLQNNEFTWDNWAKYGCENICSVCDPANEAACKLIKDTDFLKKLLRRIAAPMIDRVFILEDKIRALHDEFSMFLKRVEEQYLKIELLHSCIEEIEILRTKINENHTQFLCTMEEVQDMLDSKMDKIHIPALKKYIRDRFSQIEKELQILQSKRNCPKAAGIIMSNICCLSCRSPKVCSEVGVEVTPLMRSAVAKKRTTPVKTKGRICGCAPPTLGGSSQKTQVRSVNLSECIRLRPSGSSKPPADELSSTCLKGGDGNYNLLEGLDGNLYRKG